ncbi:hypothetical protein J1605_009971 [Eschrichtius robustus]|uniref:Uncharacterized protein n=1 Tax=Eschrichtius robustus TaxID=9764 RepID=A0AB34GU35_ESCRO|nr:hypothetical protein J1605_009971 [Eschrichtius robustus]
MDSDAPFRTSPAGRRTLRGPCPRRTPDSFAHLPNPGEAPRGREGGRAAGDNDRVRGLWVAAAEEARGIRLFLAGTRPQAGAREGPASRPPPLPSSPTPRRGGERRWLEGPGGGGEGRRGAERSPGRTSGVRPPQSIRVPPLHSSRTRGRPRCRCGRVSRGATLPPRRPSGMDSGRDFLTLHGEYSAGSRGDPAWADLEESRSRPRAGDPQLLRPPSAPPRARSSSLLSHGGNLHPGLPGATLGVSRLVPQTRPVGRRGVRV